MSNQQQSASRIIRMGIAAAAAAVVLSACGGGDAGIDQPPVITETNISAEPAFLSRSCDGQASPHLFCPNANGV